jgi:hypothetical protein
MKKVRLSLVMAGVSLLFFYNCSLTADKELNFPLPELSPLMTPNQCHCEAIVSAGLYADTLLKKQIWSTLYKGTDKVSIQIEGDTLYFLSGASFGIGEAKPAQFKIVNQPQEQVVAIRSQEMIDGYTIDIFTLNKKTGLAVWTKTRSNDAISGGTPSTQSSYLKCM